MSLKGAEGKVARNSKRFAGGLCDKTFKCAAEEETFQEHAIAADPHGMLKLKGVGGSGTILDPCLPEYFCDSAQRSLFVSFREKSLPFLRFCLFQTIFPGSVLVHPESE